MVFGFKFEFIKPWRLESRTGLERLEHFRQLAQQDGQGFGNPGGGMMPHRSGTRGRGGFGIPGRGGFGGPGFGGPGFGGPSGSGPDGGGMDMTV